MLKEQIQCEPTEVGLTEKLSILYDHLVNCEGLAKTIKGKLMGTEPECGETIPEPQSIEEWVGRVAEVSHNLAYYLDRVNNKL